MQKRRFSVFRLLSNSIIFINEKKMSALGRFVFSQSCRFLTKRHILRPAVFQQSCFISTSKKNKDTVAVSEINNKLPAHENYKETDDVCITPERPGIEILIKKHFW